MFGFGKTTPSDQVSTDIVPVKAREIAGELMQTINARDLHRGLGVGRDFSNWIKGRIDRGQFQEGVDFVAELDSPNPANQVGHGGDRRSINYTLSLDMAKHLARGMSSQPVIVVPF